MKAFMRLHPRLLFATFLGIITFFMVRPGHSPLTAALVAWDMACWVWIASMLLMMGGTTPARMRETAGEEDVGAAVVLFFVCIAAGMSVAGVIFELASAGSTKGYATWHYLLAIATVAGSWFAVGLVYTTHYAHAYYGADESSRPLRFPESPASPGYWDFLYFAFTISAAAATSDVEVMTTSMRRLVTVHSVLGFFFNAAIIGFSINMLAGALGH